MFMVIDFSFLLQCGGSVCLEAFNIIQALSGDYMASLDTLGGECWMEMLVFEICEHFCVFSFICSEDWHSCWDLLFLNVFFISIWFFDSGEFKIAWFVWRFATLLHEHSPSCRLFPLTRELRASKSHVLYVNHVLSWWTPHDCLLAHTSIGN